MEIEGRVIINECNIETCVNDFDKDNKKYYARLHFDFTINCIIEGIEIEPISTNRIFQLSKKDYDKLKAAEII